MNGRVAEKWGTGKAHLRALLHLPKPGKLRPVSLRMSYGPFGVGRNPRDTSGWTWSGFESGGEKEDTCSPAPRGWGGTSKGAKERSEGANGASVAMGHSPWRSHFGVDEHPFATYFDVHQGYRGVTHSHVMFVRCCVLGEGRAKVLVWRCIGQQFMRTLISTW